MIKSEGTGQDSAMAEPDVTDKPKVNWTVADTADSGEGLTNQHEGNAPFEQLLQICLSTMSHQMHLPLDLMLQTIDQLAQAESGSMTDEQRRSLAMLRQQAQDLEYMIDGLIYITGLPTKT
jgi:K+-sensing histidine kinase KdpD